MTYSIMSDFEINHEAQINGMIDPFVARQVRENGCISYGLSSFGYDARLAPEFVSYRSRDNGVAGLIDPKLMTVEAVETKADAHYIEPHGFILGRTIERFKIPPNVLALCVGKSTYARCGLIVNVTPLEPGWEGHVTLEISNTTPFPAKVYANEGICQFVFFRGHQPTTTYADRSGKYQGQVGIVGPRV